MTDYYNSAKIAKQRLNAISPSMCMAKWLQVSLHLPQGRTHSCYHPPTHAIPLDELKKNPNALHNTKFKMQERKLMKEGKRPEGCQYCWNVEDATGNTDAEQLSDRHYRSSEWWVKDAWNEVVNSPWDHDIKPRYVEVNFNQACNLKCMYCSPHLSTAWEDDVKQHGPFAFSTGERHNDIASLRENKLMPLDVARKDNPYVDAFWKWFPDIYTDLKVFRMTGGEPLMDKNTFKIFDFIKSNPNPDLEVSLTTNLCPPNDALFDKFLDYIVELDHGNYTPINDNDVEKFQIATLTKSALENVSAHDTYRHVLIYVEDPNDGSEWAKWKKYVVEESLLGATIEDSNNEFSIIKFSDIPQNFTSVGQCNDSDNNSFTYTLDYIKIKNKWIQQRNIKHIALFVSLDGFGKQAEYIRDGLDFDKLMHNVERVLSSTHRVSITFINTFNLLSIDSLQQFVEYILKLRQKYGYDSQLTEKYKGQRIWFDVPYMRFPDWMTIQLADDRMLDSIRNTIEFMKLNVLSDNEYSKSYHGFKNYEISKLERDLAWAEQGEEMTDSEYIVRMKKFVEFFNEYDNRRNKNLVETFPLMKDYLDYANKVSKLTVR